MTPERIDRANAPWFSSEPSSDQQSDVVRTLAEAGELDGQLGVVAISQDQVLLEESIEPLLAELDVKPVEVAIIDAPDGDITAATANAAVVAERFQSAGIDTVLVAGSGAGVWSTALEGRSYRPTHALRRDERAPELDQRRRRQRPLGDRGGGHRRPVRTQARPVGAAADAAVPRACSRRPASRCPSRPPARSRPGTPQPFVSAATACNNMALVEALLSEAGKDLNYATLRPPPTGSRWRCPPGRTR